jgi:hypothetical protein
MIDTQQLMLGNLVEYHGEYVIVDTISQYRIGYRTVDGQYDNCHITNINPIELTDEVKKRLGITGSSAHKSVHELQNARIINKYNALDITPLLATRYKTHDGVVVSQGDTVYMVIQDSKGDYKIVTALCYGVANNMFSTRESAEKHIESLQVKVPYYKTHDGVEVKKGDFVWFCYKEGVNENDEKDIPSISLSHEPMVTSNISYYFSSYEACQSYIDQKWAELHPEPLFVTEDGVGIFDGDTYYYCRKNGFWGGRKALICCNGNANSYSGIHTDYSYFSTEQLTQAYLNKVWADAEYNAQLNAKKCQNK